MRPSREVTVERAKLLAADDDTATFEIVCSSGTYVRTLIEELDDAYCQSLRRTRVGTLRIEDASPRVHPVEELLPFLGEVELGLEQARLLRNGVRIPAPAGASAGPEPLRLSCEGRLIAVRRIADDGRLRTEVVLPVIE